MCSNRMVNLCLYSSIGSYLTVWWNLPFPFIACNFHHQVYHCVLKNLQVTTFCTSVGCFLEEAYGKEVIY